MKILRFGRDGILGRAIRRDAYRESALKAGPFPLLRGLPPRSVKRPSPNASIPVVTL